MMAPSIVFNAKKNRIVIGSGGSNRLRTAILQVLLNLIDFNMPLEPAITRPRIHCEADHLSVEGGFDASEISQLVQYYPKHKVWETTNLFFGGTHSVSDGPNGCIGVGDPRRGGFAIVVS